MRGGFKTIINTKLNYKELDNLNYIIKNMANVNPIYRWSLEDIVSFYDGYNIPNEKYINIKGFNYKLCSDKVTRESIIEQFKLINSNYYEYIKPKIPQSVNWDEIKKKLEEIGYNKGKISRIIARMKRNKMTSIEELKL